MARRTSGVDLEYRARLDKFKKDLEEMGSYSKREIRKMTSTWQDEQREIARTARKEARDVAKAWEGATRDISSGLSELIPGFDLVSDAAERMTSGLGLAGGALAIGGAAAAAVGGLFALKEEVMSSRLELDRLATIGAQSIGTIQGLQLASRLAGSEFSGMEGAIEDLPERILDAARGSGELDEALGILGGSIRDSTGEVMSASEALPYLIGLLQDVEDPAHRSALANLAFGDSGKELMAVLGDTALEKYVDQVERFGNKIGPEAIEAAKRWKRETAVTRELWTQLKNGFADLGDFVLPALNDAIVVSSVFMSTYLGGIKDDFVDLGTALGSYVSLLSSGDLGGATRLLDDIALAGINAVQPFDDYGPAITEAMKALENFRAEMGKLEQGERKGGGAPGGSGLDLGDDSEEGPDKRLAEAARARKQLADITTRAIQAQLEGEDLIKAKLAERLQLIGELALASGDQLGAQLAAVEEISRAESALDKLRADLAAKDAERKKENARMAAEAAWDLASTMVDSFRFIAEEQGKRAKDGNEAALRSARAWWAAYKAGAIAQAIVQTALAIGQALASIPPPASFVVAAGMGVAGALQVATIAAQKPSFHSGGVMMTDERMATLRAGEGVITPEAISALGRLNRGEAPATSSATVAVYGHRLFDTIEIDRARVPTSAASRLRRRAARTRPGRSAHYAR